VRAGDREEVSMMAVKPTMRAAKSAGTKTAGKKGAYLKVAPSMQSRVPAIPAAPLRQVTPQAYVDSLLAHVRPRLVERLSRLAENGSEVLDPAELAELLEASLPDAGPAEMHPYYAAIGPFFDTPGALRQLGGVTKQALDSRRGSQTVLAMQTGDGRWLYPAWQFTGQGTVHLALVPVLKKLRGLDRWMAGVWLTNAHPGLEGRTPRRALAEHVDPEVVASLAAQDKAALAA
jgi:hypothetical protein